MDMFFSIVKDVASFFREYGVAGFLLAVLVSFFYWLGFTSRMHSETSQLDRKRLVKNSALIFLLVWYFYIVLGITVLSRSEGSTRQISFELFRTFRNTFFSKKQIYENVIMFVPLAVLLYGLDERFRKISVALLTGMISSLLIEVTQWVTETGCFEVDDILTNTIGMMLGYLGCCVLEKVFRLLIFRGTK